MICFYTTLTDSTTIEVDPVANNNPPQVQLQVVPGNQAYVGEPFNSLPWPLTPIMILYAMTGKFLISIFSAIVSTRFLRTGTYTVDLTVSDGLESVTELPDVTIATREVNQLTNNAPMINITGVLPAESGTMNDLFKFYLEAADADGSINL